MSVESLLVKNAPVTSEYHQETVNHKLLTKLLIKLLTESQCYSKTTNNIALVCEISSTVAFVEESALPELLSCISHTIGLLYDSSNMIRTALR